MDHASAHLVALTSGTMETKIIEPKLTHKEKELTLHKGQKAMHHKEERAVGLL